MMTLAEIRSALGGVVAGRQVLAPGPGHSARDRSLAVRPSPTAPHGYIVTSHAGDDWRTCRDYVASRLGIDTSRPERDLSPIEKMQTKARRVEAEKAEAADRERRKAQGLAIWAEAVDPRGTLVETYLASRCLELPAETCGAVLRYHGRCPFGRDEAGKWLRVPAMVAIMRDVLSDEPVAVHRTGFSRDGEKLGRKMLGPSGGAAVKLDAAETVTTALTVGEGIESALSARQLGFRPTWALGSSGEVARLPILAGVEALSLLEEIDEAGTSARDVERCGTQWHEAGRKVRRILPKVGKDMNDHLRGIA